MPRFNVFENHMVPRHSLATDEEIAAILEKYQINKTQLPKMLIIDPCVKALSQQHKKEGKEQIQLGDVIRIDRESPTAGVYHYYRLVIEDKPIY